MTVIAATDLLFPGRQDPIGWPNGWHHADARARADQTRYIIWVDPGRPYRAELGNGWQGHAASRPELAPRTAFHLVACRNGGGS